MRVWVDLTNSPHVLVLRPVVDALRAQGHHVEVTARDFAQTVGLAQRFGMEVTVIGRHRGGKLAAKALGLVDRSAALARWARGRGFDLALGHGSNDVTVAARGLRIPCSTMFDYEWATVQHTVNCRLAQAVVVPDAIGLDRLARYGVTPAKHRPYAGLKEEYYLHDFEPDARVLVELGLDRDRPLAIVRTPPAVSLYHRFENPLFARVLDRLEGHQAVVLPRVAAQRAELEGRGWVVPERAIDAQSLMTPRDNLTVQTRAHVLKVTLQAGRCTGVTLRLNGAEVSVTAHREVILAAGAVQTPQILELSGIGQPSLLQRLGIAVVHAAPRVGENYLDHFATRMNWRVKNMQTLNETAQGWRVPLAVLQYVTQRRGILTLGTGLVHGFVKTRADMATPDVQYFLMHASYANAAVRKLDNAPGMTVGVTGLRPTSQGSIHIQSPDPLAAPAIRPNFLATPHDQQTLVDGMKIARRLIGQSAMAHCIAAELSPGLQAQLNPVSPGVGPLVFVESMEPAFFMVAAGRQKSPCQCARWWRLRRPRLPGRRSCPCSSCPTPARRRSAMPAARAARGAVRAARPGLRRARESPSARAAAAWATAPPPAPPPAPRRAAGRSCWLRR